MSRRSHPSQWTTEELLGLFAAFTCLLIGFVCGLILGLVL